MNILILSWRGPGHPHGGGAEQASHEHAVSWSKSGHNVTLFTSGYEGSKAEEDVDGVHVIRKGGQVFQVHLRAIIWYLFSPHPAFDIVIDEIHGIPFFTPLFVKTKKLVFIHEVAKEVWKLNPWPRPFNLIPALIGTLMEPLFFRLIYRNIPFMTVSESTKKDLIMWDIPKDNIWVIHNGFRKKFPEKQSKKESINTIIYLGALSKDKGIEEALKVFQLLSKEDESWQFWVVGKGEPHYLEYLKKESQKLKISKEVKFFGFVDEKEKYKLLAKAHILLNPSIREGWGLVVIEAASVGTPTIAYDVAGLRDSVKDGETGLLALPNPIDCAGKIKKVFKDKKLYELLRENCFKWSKEFSWEEASRQSLNLLKKIVQKINC